MLLRLIAHRNKDESEAAGSISEFSLFFSNLLSTNFFLLLWLTSDGATRAIALRAFLDPLHRL